MSLHVIRNRSQFEEMFKKIKDYKGLIALDTETTGLTFEDRIIGYSFTLKDEDLTSYYLVTLEYNVETKELNETEIATASLNLMKSWVASQDIIFHNSVFDICQIFHNYDIDLTDQTHCDTMLQRHTLNPACETRFSLKSTILNLIII